MAVRPLRHLNHELGHWVRNTIEMWIRKNWGTNHVCSQSHIVCHGNVSHKMRRPVPDGVVQSSMLGHHAAIAPGSRAGSSSFQLRTSYHS